MKQVTRNIDPASARDLLRRVPRACIAFATASGVWAQPVRLNWHDDQYRIGIPLSVAPQLQPDQEVVLLVDEGVYYFDLRAIYVRGSVQPGSAQPGRVQPAEPASDYAWFELTPSKIVAWDYGSMRKVDDEN